MLEQVRNWLNGNRDYYTGLVMYAKLPNDKRLLELFKKRKTDYTNTRLQEELFIICNQLKNEIGNISGSIKIGDKKNSNKLDSAAAIAEERPTNNSVIAQSNPILYTACKDKANKVFKEAMNARAILFSLAQNDDYYQPNLPHKVAERSPIAIDVMQQYILASKLYDDAAFVLEHGRLPYVEDADNEQDEYAALPDTLVKQALDNLRKNIHKIKKREMTPERLELLQKHQTNLAKLEERWRLLRP